MGIRLLRVLTILAIASICYGVWALEPHRGTVSGVCLDHDTGQPIPHARIWLYKSSSDDTSSDNEESAAETDNLGGTEAPYGWNQGSGNDDEGELRNKEPKDDLEARADASGHYVISDVPAGDYTASISARGYDPDNDETVTVKPDTVSTVNASLSLSQPSLSFSDTTGCWLPGEEPIVGLNGDIRDPHVTLTLSKADLDDLAANSPSVLLTSRNYYGDTNASKAPKLTTIRTWSVELKHSDESGDFYQHINVGELDEGFYQITATGSGTQATGWIDVTRLALVRKMYRGHILAFVADLEKGKPQPSIPLTLLESTKAGQVTLASATTDASGLATIDIPAAAKEERGILLARQGDSVAAVSLELNSPGETGQGAEAEADGEDGANKLADYSAGALRSFIYTDRPIYRPGQTVYFKGIDRFFMPQAATDLAVPASQPVTVDIRDAQENLIAHRVLMTDDMGSWNGSIEMSTEALTGEYTIKATIAGQESEGTFVVAAYHKPEFQVKLAFDRKRYVRGDTIKATVTASYYFGAPLARAKVRYWVSSDDNQQTSTLIPQPYNPNMMSTSDQTTSGSEATSGDMRLDDNGQAVITLPTKVDRTDSQDATYTFNAEVTDASERSVEATDSVVVGQGEFSLNVDATPYSVNPGTPVSIKVTATNADGKPLPAQSVKLVTAFEAWSKGQERLSGIDTRPLTMDAYGMASTAATPTHGGLYLVRVKASDRRGNAISSETTVWVTSENADLPIQYPEMAVLLDKPKYKIGETAKALINTDHPGATALVTIEGDTLYRSWIVPLDKRSTAVDIPVDVAYSPGVTISACAIYGKQFLSSSERLVIDDTRRRLSIAVSADRASYHPGDPATISVTTTDTDGHPVQAEVSVGVVDSSIYAIKEDSSGSIEDAMLPDQGNIVDTDYSCPQLYLGDVDKGSIQVKLRKNFPDTAYWNPSVKTGIDGKASVQLTLPDNLTTWRITCVGHTMSSEVGKNTGTMLVQKDLVARLETPNFLIDGDNSTLTGVVNNNTTHPITASVRLDATGLYIIGPATQQVSVPAGGATNVTWPIATRGQANIDLQMRAWTADGLSDGVEQPLTVHPHASHSDIWQSGSLVNFADRPVTLERGSIQASSLLRIRLSPSLTSAMVPAWKYLSAYPYGGTDDTASVLIGDAVLASNYAVVMGQPSPPAPLPNSLVPRLGEGGKSSSAPLVGSIYPPPPQISARLRDEIERGELRLARFQKDTGGWAWFSTDKDDLWMTTYATWSLLLARDSGFAPNPTVLKAGIKRTAEVSGYWIARPHVDYGTPSSLAMAALVLARGGDAKSAAKVLDFLEQRRAHATGTDTQYLCQADLAVCILAAHAVGGEYAAKAKLWMDQLWSHEMHLGELAAWQCLPHRSSEGSLQEAPDDDTTAWAMIAAEAVNPADPRIDAVARWIMANRTGSYWFCPRTTAVTLMALGAYLAAAHELEPDFTATVTVNGKPVKSIHFGPDSVDQPDISFDVPGLDLAARGTATSVRLQKSGQGRLYYALDLRESKAVGAPPKPMGVWQRWYYRAFHPDRLEPPFEPSGYRVKRVFLRNTSRRNFLWEDTVPAPSHDFQANDDIIVRLIVDATRAGSHLIVEEPVPAGCTISEVSGDSVENWDNWWSYTDVRDDKIVFFIGDLTRGRHEIDYHLRAASPGTYDIMPTSITGTFDPTLHALGPADRITVE